MQRTTVILAGAIALAVAGCAARSHHPKDHGPAAPPAAGKERTAGAATEAAEAEGSSGWASREIARRAIPKFPNNWFMRQRMSGDRPPSRARSRALEQFRSLREERGGAAADTDAAPGVWASAGPENVGGRVTALAVDPNDPDHIWLGAADGGVWDTTDGGVSWTPRFDDQASLSIGSIATHPTDSNIVYVGGGEDNGGGYSYDGEGILKTTDGGLTWATLGLAETRRIGGIAIDANDPSRLFVAAGGDVFSEDANRGVYRSTDGGQSWQKVLFVAGDTGAIDVAIDPADSNHIYAAMWTRISSDTEIFFGGPDSGIWQSTDGGDTWTKSTTGLPSAGVGRIGLAIAPSNPSTVYARFQNDNGSFRGVWKSTDSGATWFRSDNNGFWRWFLVSYGYYFGEILVDPQDEDRVYMLDLDWFESTNGGVSFQRRSGGLHVDHQAMVIQPGRFLMGNDGGFYSSTNGGASWTHATVLNISQAYDIGIDRTQPLRRFMGLQDNGTVRTTNGGLANWTNVLGGDGLQCEVDPTDSNLVYASSQGGNINRSTDGGDSFQNATSGIASERTNWNAPVTHDPHTTQVLYTGTIRVYRSTDGAVSWQSFSPDLTNGPALSSTHVSSSRKHRERQSHLADLVEGTVTAIGVSPVDTDVIWAGTDDGNVWVTDDAGGLWTRVNVPGRTEWVTRVTADPFDANSAYVTFTGFRNGSKMPRIFRTEDLGNTWLDISGDLPDAPLNDVEPDPMWKGRLFVGSDVGHFLTDDWGVGWTDMNGGMPVVVVHDLTLHDPGRTLYSGTHGRSLWTYDLNQLPPPDRDGDGAVNVEDCAPDDGGAFAAPAEVTGLDVAADEQTISWDSAVPGAGPDTLHDVLKGLLGELPVGSGGSEACLASGLAGSSTTDTALPSVGDGFWYLVRGTNQCGTGSYGAESSSIPRTSAACP